MSDIRPARQPLLQQEDSLQHHQLIVEGSLLEGIQTSRRRQLVPAPDPELGPRTEPVHLVQHQVEGWS